MEEAVSAEEITKAFGGGPGDPNSISVLGLAFVGDAVYSLVVRTVISTRVNTRVEKLHSQASSYARASFQSEMAAVLSDELSEEEMAVYRRGRNAKSHAAPKSATSGDYHRATGLEALIGYLYLKGEEERILELMKMGIERVSEKEDGI